MIFEFLKSIQKTIYSLQRGQAQPHVYAEDLAQIKIPLPSLNIQQKIVSEIEVLEKKEEKTREKIQKLQSLMSTYFAGQNGQLKRLDEICEFKAGTFVKVGDISHEYVSGLYPCYGGNGLRGYTKTYTNEGLHSLVGRQGALCGNVHLVSGKFHATEHALVVYPKNDVNTIWLHYQLVFMKLNRYATGAAQPGLSVMNLNPIEINVPSLFEQEKIETQIEKIEKQIEALENEIAEIPKQKEAILKKWLN